MREIKFRAWDTQLKTYTYSGYGSKTWAIFAKRTNCPRFIIEQYTGLKDKNDKEIFEGDYNIDYDDGTIFIITFKDGCFGYNIYEIYERNHKEFIEFQSIENYHHDSMDFLQNIHENPELLKQ